LTFPLIVLIPFLAAWLPVLAMRSGRNASAWSAGAVLAAALALLLSQAPRVLAGETLRAAWQWLPQAGINLSFRLDGLGLLFCLLILGIGLLVVLYAAYYLSDDDPIGRFFAYLLLFAGAMLGVVLSENVLLLVVFWELTSLTSFLLIAFWHHRSDAREGARMALAVTGAGGLSLLAGMVLLGQAAGSFELTEIFANAEQVRASPLYLPLMVLILLGAFTKSAQFPFHFWLPHAMAAPTPVSAYLHSATMVKAGIFLLARFYPVLSGTDAWFYIVTTTGFVTFAFGAYAALWKHDLKGLLAYSTISHLGLITLLFGLQTKLSVVAAVFHIINHATFKASLFMAAGIIDHEAGTRDMRKLNGLWKTMPYTGMLAMVAAGAMAGVPLLNGFLSKEMFLAETVQFAGREQWGLLLPVAVTLASVFSVAYSVRFIDDVFFNGEPQGLTKTPHEPPHWMRIPVELLVAVCLAVGIFPEHTVAPLLAAAVDATVNGAPVPPYSLAIWHGFNLPLAMSGIALAGGLFAYYFLQRTYDLHRHLPTLFNGHWLYHKGLGRLLGFSGRLTAGLENNSLQRYLGWLVIAALVLAAWPFLHLGWSSGDRPRTPVNGMALVIWLILAVCIAAAVALHRQRLVALIMVSAVGLVPTLVFAWLGAPDLGLTQVTVEVVTIVLLLLALHWLPQHSPAEPSSRRGRTLGRAAIALAAGGGMAALAYAVLTRPFRSLSDFYLANSMPGGGGANVVNVILVDFRGYDTFGEIIVLAIAALGIAAMMGKPLSARRAADQDGRPWSPDLHPLMLSVLTSLLLPLALMVAVFIFMRGHNLPGGGFVAGLVTGIALILLYIANGIGWAGARMQLAFAPVIGAGVFIAGLTGIASWLFARPFLTSAHGHPNLPVIGDLPLASAMAFDLGVYLTVVGVVLLVLSSLGRATVAARPETDKET
jgi:multicomponent K+:H+ antiporter subunit A